MLILKLTVFHMMLSNEILPKKSTLNSISKAAGARAAFLENLVSVRLSAGQ